MVFSITTKWQSDDKEKKGNRNNACVGEENVNSTCKRGGRMRFIILLLSVCTTYTFKIEKKSLYDNLKNPSVTEIIWYFPVNSKQTQGIEYKKSLNISMKK